MSLKLLKSKLNPISTIQISGSKSETNRLLILQALYPEIMIENISDSDDSVVLQQALSSIQTQIDIGHAGTAMRFLTAFYAFHGKKEKILTGSQRMQNRPIEILVEALNSLGAEISYEKKHGFPPLKIRPQKPKKSQVDLSAEVSSQYISALLLVASKFSKGLKIQLKGEILSRPYIEMTLKLLEEIGIQTIFENNLIQVYPAEKILPKTIVVEPDWSSASYYYSLIALSEQAEIRLKNFKENSLQGDAQVAKIYAKLGVETTFLPEEIILKKKKDFSPPDFLKEDLKSHPDLAQTLAVTCVGLKIPFEITGLSTLKIKETDRLAALQNELSKFGATIQITKDSLQGQIRQELTSNILVKTYDDHRMAMAFAPLCLKVNLSIEHPEVVSKSYPSFWEDLKKCGVNQV